MGGTWPAFSKVKKLGRAKKSRSFEVAAVSFAASFAPWRLAGWLADGLAGGGVGSGVWPALVAGGWADWFASEVSGFGALCAAQQAPIINKQTSAKWVSLKLVLLQFRLN